MDCTNSCRSKQHLYQLAAVIQNSTAEESYACILRCSYAFRGADSCGRTLLHAAASCGKRDVLEWLLQNMKGNTNTKDKESGWTALHRALFYGQISCAVKLIQSGASLLTCKDNEKLTPLDLIVRDHRYVPFVQSHKEIGSFDVYTWGENTNYTLGHGKEGRTQTPDVVEYFRKKQISIQKVVMRRYHTIFLTSDGVVFTCGHGQGGRLGLGHEEPTLLPLPTKPIFIGVQSAGGDNSEQCSLKWKDIDAGQDHSLFLGSNGRVYSCGLNNFKQLGLAADTGNKVLEPRLISLKQHGKGPPIKCIAAGWFHSVICTDTSVFTFGLNAGQLGHSRGERCITPRLVTSLSNQDGVSVQLVTSCSAAIVIVMSKKDGFYLLHKYDCRFVNFRGMKIDKRISCISVNGGELEHSFLPELLHEKGGCTLRVIWNNPIGQLFLWTEEGGGQVRRVIHSLLGRQLPVVEVCSSIQEALVTTEDGEAFILPWGNKSTESSVKDTVDIKAKRIPAHRAVHCSANPNGGSYALLQAKEYTCFFAEVDDSEISKEFGVLMDSATEQDGCSDITLLCQGKRIVCHRFILVSRSSYFRKLLLNPETSVLNIEGTSIQTLLFVLKYLYTDMADFNLLPSMGGAQDRKSKVKDQNRLQKPDIVEEIAKSFSLKGILLKRKSGKQSRLTFPYGQYQELCDVILVSSDGQELMCHKCVLMARLEYFHHMLSCNWLEGLSSSSHLELAIPNDILTAVIQYLYSDDFQHIKAKNDVEFTFNVLVVADQLLMKRLKRICEMLVVDQLTVRNVTQVMQLATTYNATQLKDAVLLLMCLNLAELLEHSLLDDLEVEHLDELGEYYRTKLTCMSRRRLGWHSGGPSHEELSRCLAEEQARKAISRRQNRRGKIGSLSSSSTDSTDQRSLPSDLAFSFDEDSFTDLDERVPLSGPVGIGSGELTAFDRSSGVLTAPNIFNANRKCDSSTQSSSNSAEPLYSVSLPEPGSPVPPVEHELPVVPHMSSLIPSLRDIMQQEAELLVTQRPEKVESRVKSKQKNKAAYKTCYEHTDKAQPSPKPDVRVETTPKLAPWSMAKHQPAPSLLEVMNSQNSESVRTNNSKQRIIQSRPSSTSQSSRPAKPPVDPVTQPAWVAPDGGPSSPSEQSLHVIMDEERKEMESLQRSTNKPLELIQIEEKAIEELYARYMAQKKKYETISIERLVNKPAAPLWVAHK